MRRTQPHRLLPRTWLVSLDGMSLTLLADRHHNGTLTACGMQVTERLAVHRAIGSARPTPSSHRRVAARRCSLRPTA
jgi:hypothetical protein